MPIELTFHPRKNVTIKRDSNIVEEFVLFILNLPFLPHQGASTSTVLNSYDEIVSIDINIKGLSVIDNESSNMLSSLIHKNLDDTDMPFYLSGHNQHDRTESNEAVFLHERFRPIKSQNAKHLSKIKSLEVPEEFCCALGYDIMDEPVFDIRSPHIMYDYAFLMYWLNKSSPKIMPNTRLPYEECFLKINYTLKSKINTFMETTIKNFEHAELNLILTKLKLNAPTDKLVDKVILDQALRRSVVFGESKDLSLLLRFGADINSQDNNPQRKFTALHLALDKGDVDIATELLHSGAKINIKDANNRSSFDIIRTMDNNKRKQLLFICERLELINNPVNSLASSNRNGLFAADRSQGINAASQAALSSNPTI